MITHRNCCWVILDATSREYCCLLITLATSLDIQNVDQSGSTNVRLNLDPNCFDTDGITGGTFLRNLVL